MQVEIRKLTVDDYDELAEAMQKAYPVIDDNVWSKRNIQKLTSIFAEGQICILVDGKLAAAALSINVNYELYGDQHTYDEITGNGTFNTHSNIGNVL